MDDDAFGTILIEQKSYKLHSRRGRSDLFLQPPLSPSPERG